MPFPNVETTFETFFEATRIWLFGKPFLSLTYNRDSMSGVGNVAGAGPDATHANEFTQFNAPVTGAELQMPPKRIERTLRKQSTPLDPDGNPLPSGSTVPPYPIFARIYSFSYEGHYYSLPRPLLFLVANNGHRAQDLNVTGPTGAITFNTKYVGVEARD